MTREELEPTTKNDLGVDAVSRQAVLDLMIQKWGENFSGDSAMQESIDAIREMPSVTPQEPFKPMVEIDLDYVIKQKYIERDVLDKIRAEVERLQKMCDKNFLNLMAQYSAFGMVLDILDKYKAEIEPQESEDTRA